MNLENYFISQFKNSHIGDDGALINGTVYSKDAFFEDVHFKTKWMSYYQIATKAMAVNISDAIAMNAKPKYALLSVAMPKSITKSQAKELADGFKDCASTYGVEIIGGDTIANVKLDITVTIISKTTRPLRRKGLKRGHLIAYSGELGRSAKDLKKLMNLGKIHKKSKFVNIKLRDKFISKSARFLSCGMDISDGLFSDLSKLSSVNRVGFKFYKKIPKSIGCSGEEYEMLFGFDKRYKKALLREAKLCRTPINIIGECVRKNYKNMCKAHHF
ncbi:MAG: thiamine-phosphate kinase [Campylobacterota bacterium]